MPSTICLHLSGIIFKVIALTKISAGQITGAWLGQVMMTPVPATSDTLGNTIIQIGTKGEGEDGRTSASIQDKA